MRSTIVIAPIRKMRVSQVLPRWSSSSCPMFACGSIRAYTDHISPNMNRAVAALSIFILCSRAMHAYPSTKIITNNGIMGL